MKEMKRWLAMILCFVMLIGVMPVNALAVEWGDVAAFFEDAAKNGKLPEGLLDRLPTPPTAETEGAEAPEDAEETEAPAGETEATEAAEETEAATEPTAKDDGVLQILAMSDCAGSVAKVLTQVKAENADIDDLFFLGDTTNLKMMLAETQTYYPLDGNVVLVQGDEDAISDLTTMPGGHDTDSYGLFVMNEQEYQSSPRDILTILSLYLAEKTSTGYDKPVFVLFHRGLHDGADNAYAAAMFEALNDAAEKGLEIVYIFGDTEDTAIADGSIYLPVESPITIGGKEETLNFTYMNAGAVSESMTVFTFDEVNDEVTVSRYDAGGLTDLKNAGTADPFTQSSPAVIGEPAYADLVEEPMFGTFNATNPADTETQEETATQDDGTDAQAEGDTIYVLAGGDFQEAGDHANSAANVTNILAQVTQKYATMDGFLFIGDYDCETHDSATETANGITALMGAVQGSYSNLNDANSVLVQGNHDYMDSRIDATGGHEFDGYAAYVLNEDDYPNGGGSQAGIQTLANNLKSWLNNKIGEGYDAPIFIVSHLPLAYTPRTVTQGDAKYAKYIFDVLNDAGKNGLNIIFMHGHDHAYGPDNYMGGEAIYLPEGDKICIAEAGSTSAWTEETLNFTYMNAGYTGYYSDAFTYVTNAGTDKLTMTVFAITDNTVTVERYSEDGLYNLKSAGYDGSYSDTSVTNKSLSLPTYSAVYASPQTIALTTNSDSTGGDSFTAGTIGEYVGISGDVDDVTTSGNKWVTINEATNGTVGSDPTYEYVLDTDGIEYGEAHKYIIVDDNEAIVLNANSAAEGTAHEITISGNTATLDTRDYEYHVLDGYTSTTDREAYHLITKGDGSSYLYQESNRVRYGTRDTVQFQVNHHGNGMYDIHDVEGAEYYVVYSGSAWTVNTTTSNRVRFYKFDQTIPGSNATPGSNGLYGYLDGDLSYVVASGTSAADALAAVKAGIAVKYTNYEDYSNVGEYADDGEGMSWVLDTAYDGTTPGDYAVTISYNGTTLGTAEVIIAADMTYYIAEGEGLYEVEMGTSADDAMAAVKAGVTVSSADDTNGTNKTTIDDSQVTWKWVDAYDPNNYGPYTVDILYEGTSLGTVEVKVNVQYETGIVDGWTAAGTTEGGYKYVLDTDGIDYNTSNTSNNNRYIIVAADKAIALGATPTSTVNVTLSSDGSTAVVSSRDNEYHFYNRTSNSGREIYICHSSGQYLYHGNYVFSLNSSRNGRAWTSFTHNGNGVYTLLGTDGNGDWQMYYSNSNSQFRVADGSGTVRLYKYEGETEASTIYASIEGNTVYTVTQGTSATGALNKVKAGITGYLSSNADGSNATELQDSDLTWTWKNKYNGQGEGPYWVEISYNGVVLGTVEVKVVPRVINNYPEYPNEGSIKVNKTGTGIDFQSSGIAQVEVSASGVPIKKGADVIVMLDTSSSMNTYNVTGSDKSRLTVLEESMESLVKQFQTPGDDGEPLDIRVAIADFNGFNGYGGTTGTPYDRDENDRLADKVSYTANGNQAKIYTGSANLTANAFVDAQELKQSWVGTLSYASGTNYDYAFDAVYQLGTAIKAANGNEERDLYVIFMSDGAAMQWNYYHSNGRSEDWQYWLTGAWDPNNVAVQLDCDEHAYYYAADVDGDGYINEHRMADAIKGSPNETYEVIRKTAGLGEATGQENMYKVPGLGATMFAIAFDPTTDQNTPPEAMTESIKTIASDQTGTTQYYYEVTAAEQLSAAFDAIGSEIAYAAYNARFVDQMGDAYNLQLLPAAYTVVDGTSTTDKTLEPKIEILTYDIYTKADADAGRIPTGKNIGDRKGTYTVLETITTQMVEAEQDAEGNYTGNYNLEDDGNYVEAENGRYKLEVYSDQINNGTTNILADGTQEGYVKGVIYAKTFLYNTNATAVAVDGVSIPTGTTSAGLTTGITNELPSETFYWKMGTVQTSELAMRYYVYLEGSMEGTREGGSYPTNEFATLYYDNYLGNACKKETVSPVMAWKEANVSYAFYLVDENGNIIVNQTTGQTGTFANKIAVTNPVVYDTILLNNLDTVRSIEVASATGGILPVGYELYDGTSVYTITINSNTTGSWEIVKGADKVASTYVTQYDSNNASAYSNALVDGKDANGDAVVTGHDYTHTVVWFAVLWKVQALPDTVVIDYGLPVDISVLTNDMFGENGKLAGVGAYSDTLNLDGHDADLASGFGESYIGTYGTAKANTSTGKVRYTPSNMQMNGYDKFAYAVNYTGNENAGYYYDTVTVIPATTIYYEDSFVSLKSYTWNGGWTEVDSSSEKWVWSQDGTTVDGIQDEDRPGQYSLTDANNIYGYDSVNKSMSIYSMGSAMKASVDYDNYGEASFTFYGTGFDIVSMTSNTTGTIYVDVYQNDTLVEGKSFIVDTYYGYHQVSGDADGDGTIGADELIWEVNPDANDSIYQVPVIKVENLTYGQYTAKIRAFYDTAYDNVEGSTGYDFYLDAIRIYDPANDGVVDNDNVIEDAYKADGEGWPSYIELRNNLIKAETLGNADTDTVITGLVYIDGDAEVGDAQIKDYVGYGPNNEVYLAPEQRVAFMLNTPDNIKNVHIGIKSANGVKGTYTITNIAKAADTENNIEAGKYYNAKTFTIDTTTDMYYDLSGWVNGDIIVISNTGKLYDTTGIISLTNIKSTYTSNPGADVTTDEPETTEPEGDVEVASVMSLRETEVYMTPAAATLTLRSLNNQIEEEPEETLPEETEPETTVPEETEPETTVPEETEPETTVPEETEPEDSNDQAQQVIQQVVQTVKNILQNLFGHWFR